MPKHAGPHGEVLGLLSRKKAWVTAGRVSEHRVGVFE